MPEPEGGKGGRVAAVATIGYQLATVRTFIEALNAGGVEVVADVRAVASSRRPGFSKSRLAANLAEAGIGYVHLRDLGTPAEGRAAARAGRHAELRRIYRRHLATAAAREELRRLADLVGAGPRVCLLCLEADPTHCHRTLVASALAEVIPVEVVHLHPAEE